MTFEKSVVYYLKIYDERLVMKMNFEELTLQEKITVLRTRQGMTTSELCTTLGITRQAFNYRMKTGDWKISWLKGVADIFGVEIADLV